MNRHVSSITGRLSLRPPQRDSLEILARVCEICPPTKEISRDEALEAIQAEYPGVVDFEREFPSLCFALATGVGKTRLMGAFVTYLYLAHNIRNFFVLAPNLTIYNKLITDFTPNTPKYVFKGITDFAINPPVLITGDNYESQARTLYDQPDDCKINIFNIANITSEVRGGKSPRIKRLSEYIGESYFAYLSKLSDLVMLMDESHRYRASSGARAINDLRPRLGLELTATPFVETSKGAIPFKNVVLDYPLARAMADEFVKEPAVITRKDFSPAGLSHDEIDRIKLEDGVRLHEQVKVQLETYARDTDQPIVKPFVLVIARDTTHATQLLERIQGDTFFEGRYKDRVIQVDSSKTGKDEDEMIERLLRVEHTDEPTEIVIHVNMLKEGWDVTNLYTIVPLRAANARILIEQSIGRGLRLPYGKRSGLFTISENGERVVHAVDRLNIIAHDKFQEIVDEAKRSDSPIRLQQLVLDGDELSQSMKTVVSKSGIAERLGFGDQSGTTQSDTTSISDSYPAFEPLFTTVAEQRVAQIAYDVIRSFETKTDVAPTIALLQTPEVQAKVVAEVKRRRGPQQREMFTDEDVVANVVARTTEHVILGTIDIPRIIVVPKDEVRRGFTELRASAYTANAQDGILDFRQPPKQKSKIAQYLYTGFDRCLYRLTKFHSNTERMLAIILERGAERWFRPAKGQFQIFYKDGHDHREYQPDFVAEMEDCVLMIETKSSGMVSEVEVLAKRDAAIEWCKHATKYAQQHGGKPWKFIMVPHDAVAENRTLAALASAYEVRPVVES